MKKELKLKAIELRKEKKSYREIAELLHVSKSTVSYWLCDIDWSREIQEQLTERTRLLSQKRLVHLNELKRVKWQKVYLRAEAEAIFEFEKFKQNPLFVAGICLYWGEGDRNFLNGKVRLSNVDERLLSIFRVFLEGICKVDKKKISAYILLYPDLDKKTCLNYWSKSIGIEKEKFFKTSVIEGRHKKNRLAHGVCSINVSSKYLKKKILVWIDLFSKQIK
ncbi:MAG: helix-turn-helix domain-containing protein [Patescibacteria group bacterium]